ncbi:MAG: HmuY family protein [Bacteroidota bacterium]|nr:HmuY family protein [Bacteroidota bacterium]
MRKTALLLSTCVVLFASCNQDEPKTTPNVTNIVTEQAIVAPEVGGPNQPNQVYIDLSSNTQTAVNREKWDFGFYCGDTYRVIINNSIKMAVKQLNTTDINIPQEIDYSVGVSTEALATDGYVDNPFGVLNSNVPGQGTAIAEISDDAEQNKVYLVNMGNHIGTEIPLPGGTNPTGDHRGWKKIRITKNNIGDYVIQYANPQDTTHNTITISKNTDYNFVHLSLTSGQTVSVQPQKTAWDLCYTTNTNYTGTSMQTAVLYFFTDLVFNNIHGGVRVYEVTTTAEERDQIYTDYKLSEVEHDKFSATNLAHQQVIGSKWRSTIDRTVNDRKFYVLKDAEGNIFKIKFLALMNEAGERGYPVFEYELLK